MSDGGAKSPPCGVTPIFKDLDTWCMPSPLKNRQALQDAIFAPP